MAVKFNGVAAASALLICSAGMAQAQRARPATPAQPSTSTTTPSTTTAPDEASTGRSTTPEQTGSAPAQAGTSPGQAGTSPGQAGTTPGQEQTSPGQASQATPAATGQTPSAQTSAQGPAPKAAPVTKADLKVGSSVYDQSGAVVGKIESASAKGAVLNTGKTRATIPVASFAKGDKGLVIGMSKADIDATAKKKSSK